MSDNPMCFYHEVEFEDGVCPLCEVSPDYWPDMEDAVRMLNPELAKADGLYVPELGELAPDGPVFEAAPGWPEGLTPGPHQE